MEYVPIDGLILHMTDDAIKFAVPHRTVWIPKSCLDEPDGYAVDDEEVRVARWFVEREDLD